MIRGMGKTGRTCRGCGAWKRWSAFHRHLRGPNGRDTRCKKCVAKKAAAYWATPQGRAVHARHQRLYRKRHPDRVRQQLATWLAAHPEYERARSRRRWKTDPRYRARIKRWCREHPEVMRRATLKWMKGPSGRAYRRRRDAAKRGIDNPSLTADEWQAILAAFDGRCAYCFVDGKMEQDHVIPLVRGGTHDASNVVPACRSCNRSKGARTPREWLARRGGQK